MNIKMFTSRKTKKINLGYYLQDIMKEVHRIERIKKLNHWENTKQRSGRLNLKEINNYLKNNLNQNLKAKIIILPKITGGLFCKH